MSSKKIDREKNVVDNRSELPRLWVANVELIHRETRWFHACAHEIGAMRFLDDKA